MKVLRVIASVDPSGGGPIEGLKRSALVCEKHGWATEVVSLDDPNSQCVKQFPGVVHGLGPTFRRYGYIHGFSSWIVENAKRYDAAVVHGLWNHASVAGGSGLYESGLPYVVFTHGMLDPWFRKQYPVKHLLKQAFWWACQGKVLSRAEYVLFTTEEERALASGEFLGNEYKSRVVAYGASEPVGDPVEKVRQFRASVPELGERPYLLFLSRIHEKKGCDLLVDAFANSALRDQDVDLVIAGPDHSGLKSKLIEKAAKLGVSRLIHWPGMLEADRKWGAFLGSEAFVLPSHQENFGIVVAEALACGAPVLTTNKVNIWREVEEYDAGYIADDTSSGVLSLLDRWSRTSRGDRESMRSAARRCFMQRFNVESAGMDLMKVLSEIKR
jgi:glycosyltransferase involved in cell wall biosynthesis